MRSSLWLAHWHWTMQNSAVKRLALEDKVSNTSSGHFEDWSFAVKDFN